MTLLGPLVTDAASAVAFLTLLEAKGWLYHPEDRAWDCLAHKGLDATTLDLIQKGMDACWEPLGDVCLFALDIGEGGEEARAWLAGGALPTLPSERVTE